MRRDEHFNYAPAIWATIDVITQQNNTHGPAAAIACTAIQEETKFFPAAVHVTYRVGYLSFLIISLFQEEDALRRPNMSAGRVVAVNPELQRVNSSS